MSATLIKSLKIVLLVAAAILLVLLLFGIALAVNLPWWMGFVFAGLVAALGTGAVFVRKIQARRKEQTFVQQVIAQDEARIKTMSAKEQTQEKELQERWKEAIASLQGSHLRKQGNPLYVLPWYMVIGESGSGKTTSIGSAKLSTFSDVNRVSGISGTRNCDWWFFEQAILLDTAGRYAMPVDQGKDKEEWQQFLNLLVKYRKKEPIHGLIVTVAADKMLESTPETMAEDGKSIRHRIDELMRVLGAKFPVYVLVTKCDLVQGMTQFCERLPEGGLNQPMGYVNQDLSVDVGTFLDRAMNTLSDRLRNLRLILLHSGGPGGTEPGLLLFPEEFGNLRRGLDPFMKAAFLANPYQETPILRGLFFSSGRQEGSPYSHFLNSLGLVGERDVLPGTNRGLFLHDFYSKVLPRDKGLFAPTKRALEWQTLTRNLGLTTWVILGIVVCGLMSYSFVKNLRTVREASNEFARSPALQRELLADMIVMDRFGQSILKVEKSNQGWWTPRFGLTESIRVEEGLKAKYCRQFREGFLTAFDRKLAGEMSSVSASTPDDAAAQYVDHLVRRINLLMARLGGQGLETISRLPQPAYLAFLSAGGQDFGPDIRKKFGSLYFYYLAWRTDTSDINQEVGILQGWLRHVLASRGTNFQWLVVWAEKQSGSPPVSLKEFWGGSQPISGERPISPAFTKKGKEQVDSFVGEIESSAADPVAMAAQKAALGKWYPQACLSAWGQFGAGFQQGVDTLKGQKEWQAVAARSATDQGPHMAFVARLASELEFLGEEENLPAWFQQAYQYQSIRSQAQAAGVAAKATESGKKLLARIERTFGKGTEGSSAALAAQKTYQEYSSSLTAVVQASASRAQAFQLAAQTYGEDPSAGKTPFFAGLGAAGRLKAVVGGNRPADDIVSKLITGPFDFLWTYVRNEAGCQMQATWEQTVLAESQGATGHQASQLLLGPEGLVWKYVKGPAAPFLTRTLKGFAGKDVLGATIPFVPGFYQFLSRGVSVAVASAAAAGGKSGPSGVSIKGLPTDANPEARVKPHGTRLELQCATGPQALVNLNYPVTKVFNWSPESCTDMGLQISVGNLVLRKTYAGDQGFPAFLQDFPGGRHTFHSAQFPAERAALEQMGIRYIRVSFRFSGEKAVVGAAKAAPGTAPRSVAACWAP
jgi:type VI secretion system protein ImpL